MRKLLAFLLAIIVSMPAWSSDIIKLVRSQSTVSSKYGISYQSVRFEALGLIRISNSRQSVRQAYVRLRRSDGSWTDVALERKGQADGDYELWAGYYIDANPDGTPTYKTFDLEFALRLNVNGVDYWNNNNGKNFKQPADSGSMLAGTNVLNGYRDSNSVIVPGGLFVNWVTLKNIGPAKKVDVIFTVDNWKTTNILPASFSPDIWRGGYSRANNPNELGFEEWYFNINVPPTATQLEYAISYTVNGQTYWDNNYGKNYVYYVSYPEY